MFVNPYEHMKLEHGQQQEEKRAEWSQWRRNSYEVLKIRPARIVRNEKIRKRTGIVKLRDRVETTKLKWCGVMMIVEEERVPRKIFSSRSTGKMPRETSPKEIYSDGVNSEEGRKSIRCT